jgi:MTH538 TIR-like domain (DUF1863)
MGSASKRPSGLFDFLPPEDDTISGLLGGLAPKPPSSPFANLGRALDPTLPWSLADLGRGAPSPPWSPADLGRNLDPSLPGASNPFAFGPLAVPPPPASNPFDPLPPALPLTPVAEPKERRAFFSFHFDDVRRSVIVRNAWKFTGSQKNSFVDSSIWEESEAQDPETVKQIIRDGVSYTSVVCVLVGTESWLRRWIRYEIARAIIDERGLLAVHLNNIRDPNTLTTLPLGPNPLGYMAVGKVQVDVWEPARYYLFERNLNMHTWQFAWVRYADYTCEVKLPPWLADPDPGFVTPLAPYADEYDYMAQDGHKNIGGWIDHAARRAGR